MPEGEDLGVRGRVTAELALVRRLRDHLGARDEDGTDRDVLVVRRRGGVLERQPHPALVLLVEASRVGHPSAHSLITAITIDAIRQATRMTIATVQEVGMRRSLERVRYWQ